MKHPLYLQLLARLKQDLQVLPDKPDETPRNTLDCLWALAAGQPLAISQVRDAVIDDLDLEAQATLNALVDKRLAGTPLSHLTGRQDFMGLVLKSSEAALVPRRETEILGRAAIGKLQGLDVEAPWVVDLCTGCGNLALAMAVAAPQARVWGSDLSEEAVALARENTEFVGRPDVSFYAGDLVVPFDNEEFLGRVDLLTCNPPYISSAKVEQMPEEISGHEPHMAFDGGPFGIKIIQRLIQDAPRLLRPGGWLLFEVGLGQGEPMKQRLERNDAFDQVEVFVDDHGDVRALAARRRR
ncbi:peptide chain release factor N(5)-glutamine methyltransferase [Thioalkalivibrio sulfidiphilus]|uniref:peptide chain release factor N(5)-glutamine methyltransferase n=1 Tax=Thioalkalivibrio sulfidiphilus TaxID=1033854 RepID=UPI0003730770|nr:peptide chain release factor N(5)-glutamine methyltransferase [Thioalkalivibrio sulfidiphilus]